MDTLVFRMNSYSPKHINEMIEMIDATDCVHKHDIFLDRFHVLQMWLSDVLNVVDRFISDVRNCILVIMIMPALPLLFW